MLLILMMVVGNAHAQLGWTIDQCRKHYGPNKDVRWSGATYSTEFRARIHGLLMYMGISFKGTPGEERAYEITYWTDEPGWLPYAVVSAIIKDNPSAFWVKEEIGYANDDRKMYGSLIVSAEFH